MTSDSLNLTGFTSRGVTDILVLLYGGDVTFSFTNFSDILKFGVYFVVQQVLSRAPPQSYLNLKPATMFQHVSTRFNMFQHVSTF